MSEKLEIVITGKNGASHAFKEVTSDAQKMGTGIAQANQKAARSYTDLQKGAKQTGLALGALGAASILLANQSAASQARLESAFQSAGTSVDEYADQLDAASKKALQLGFDDEDAADAIAKLTSATGEASKGIADLALAEDIARARGIDLASAANIVSAAEQGRIGSLRRLGIAIDENATSEEALAALQQKFSGAADTYATTSAAAFDRYKNSVENAGEAIGGVLAKHQAELITAGAAWTAFGGLATGAIKAIAPEMNVAASASRLLVTALTNPVGIAAAAGIAVVGIVKLVDALTTDYGEAVKAADAETKSLSETIAGLGKAADPFTLQAESWATSLGGVETQIKQTADQIDQLSKRQEELQTILAGGFQAGYSVDEINAAKAEYDANEKLISQLSGLQKAMGGATGASEVYAKAAAALNAIIADTGPGTENARKQTEELFRAWQAGEIGPVDFLAGIIRVGNSLEEYDRVAIQAAAATERAGKVAKQAAVDFSLMHDPLNRTGDALARNTGLFGEFERAARQSADAAAKVADQAIPPDIFHAPTLDTSGLGIDPSMYEGVDALAAAFDDLNASSKASADGIWSANSALATFKDTQDAVIAAESVYSQQQSEYGSQLRALDDAYAAIQDKQARGVALTKEETNFVNNYADARARLVGGIEDATIQEGLLGLTYAENVKKGDELNKMLHAQAGSSDTATEHLRTLVKTLDGAPKHTTLGLSLDGVDEASISAHTFSGYLGQVDGQTAYTYLQHTTTGAESAYALIGFLEQHPNTTAYSTLINTTVNQSVTGPQGSRMLGGVAGHAYGGIVARLGEAGPEALTYPNGAMGLAAHDGLYNVPVGTYVHTADTPKSRRMAAGGNGGGITISGPVYIYPATADVEREFTRAVVGEWRAN